MALNGTVVVLGLGYVGLPLALVLGKKTKTIGFDTDSEKISMLREGKDPNNECSDEEMRAAKLLEYTCNSEELKKADYIIVAVPTPIDEAKRPDLRILESASRTVGQNIKKGSIVIFESTVYPGVTEDICGAIIEKESGLKCGVDFKLGYSPERINPGDKEHTIESIIKVVSAQDEMSLSKVAELYNLVVKAGIYKAKSIKVAEAAKVIENTQRDLNIALVNELSIIFNKLDIDTMDVLDAAGTKWNFLPFKPGLVGGHCIGVDPYYLTHRAELSGYHPEVILAGRKINDNMGKLIAEQTVKSMIESGKSVKGANVLILGLSFKENCIDIRNTRVVDILAELKTYGVNTHVWDPVAKSKDAMQVYGIELCELEQIEKIDSVIAAVCHDEVMQLDLSELKKKTSGEVPFIDVKSKFDRETLNKMDYKVWRL